MKIMILCIGLVLLGGCFPHLHSGSEPSLGNLPSSPGQVFQQTITKVDYLLSLFMVAVVAGIIVGLYGFKVGWLIAVGNVVGIFLHLTIARYGEWMALAGLLSAIAGVVGMLLYARKFKIQNVKAIQTIREKFPDLKNEITAILQSEQDPLVQTEIMQIKSALKSVAAKKQKKMKQLKSQLEEYTDGKDAVSQ